MFKDNYVLRDSTRGSGGFELIGTDQEQAPLLLKNLLSYSEMMLSSLIGISGPTFFINSGARESLCHLLFRCVVMADRQRQAC